MPLKLLLLLIAALLLMVAAIQDQFGEEPDRVPAATVVQLAEPDDGVQCRALARMRGPMKPLPPPRG